MHSLNSPEDSECHPLGDAMIDTGKTIAEMLFLLISNDVTAAVTIGAKIIILLRSLITENHGLLAFHENRAGTIY